MTSLSQADASLFHAISFRSAHNIFLENTRMMAHMSLVIEQTIIERKIDGVIFSGFQRMERLKRVFPRYQQMVSGGAKVWVFGIPDAEFPQTEGLGYIPLEAQSQLALEWFLIVDHPNYARALVAEEVSQPSALPHERRFQGILTSDPHLIDQLYMKAFDFARLS